MLRPALAPGEDRNDSAVEHPDCCGDKLRPALAPGEDRNMYFNHRTPARPALRPALAPGEDRNGLDPVDLAQILSIAAPGPRAGRGSQHRPVRPVPARAALLRPALAPGEDRNVNQDGVSTTVGLELRPALAPGEDRNPWDVLLGAVAKHLLRPALAPGEDRNDLSAFQHAGRANALRPALAPGEDRNLSVGVVRGGGGCRCARPSRRARIATALKCGNRNVSEAAAPGPRAGRGSQPEKESFDSVNMLRCARPSGRARMADLRH